MGSVWGTVASLCEMIMNFRVPYKTGNILVRWATNSLSRKTVRPAVPLFDTDRVKWTNIDSRGSPKFDTTFGSYSYVRHWTELESLRPHRLHYKYNTILEH
jgi:hypothetical protein